MKIQELKSKVIEGKVSLDGPKDRFEMVEVSNSEPKEKSLKLSNPKTMNLESSKKKVPHITYRRTII